eukprot:gene9232-10207_t
MKVVSMYLHFASLFVFPNGLLGAASQTSLPFSASEENLMSKLLTNYKTYSRPAVAPDTSVNVDFDLTLAKLVKLDIKEQVFVANTRIIMRWYDPRLKWNRAEHNGTKYLNFPSTSIWTPDIMLHNTAVQESVDSGDLYKAKVRVKNDGLVDWMSPLTIQASCSLNIRWFPFDAQSCELHFGSISYTKSKLKLVIFHKLKSMEQVKAKYYYSNGEWSLNKVELKESEVIYECCSEPFSMLTYKLSFTRLTNYWLFYLIFPCTCITFISLFAFFIPPETGERSGFGITSVLAMSVYLLVISDKLPEKSDQNPIIGILYVTMFAMMSVSLLCVILTTHLSFKTTRPPPRLKWLLNWMTKMKNNVKLSKMVRMVKKRKVSTEVTPVTVLKNPVDEIDDEDIEETGCNELKNGGQLKAKGSKNAATLDYQEQFNCSEWKEIAKDIDLRLFWLFFALAVFLPSIAVAAYIT